VNGGVVTVTGIGFAPGLTASIGGISSTPLAINAGQMILAAPAAADGLQNVVITNPASGGSSTMSGVLTYGAAATDSIILIMGLNPNTPVGTQATNPVSVRVVTSDGITPVSGATIAWSATNRLQLSACGNASSCSTTTDQSGNAATWLIPAVAGQSTITAALVTPGSTTGAVNATLNATESASDIGVLTPYLWIAQGAAISLPLTARVLRSGEPVSNSKVNFTIMHGTGTLSGASAQSNSAGYATVTLAITQLAALVQVSACVAPANAPCQTFYANAVSPSQMQLQPVSGAGQVTTGQIFQPIVVRVTDSASPPDPVLAASVMFQTTVLRPAVTPPAGTEADPGHPVMPIILSVSQTTVVSDANGLSAFVPSSGGFSAPVEVDVAATTGVNAALDTPLEVLPGVPGTDDAGGPGRPSIGRPPVRSPETTDPTDRPDRIEQ
jgi:hypothetical protein